MKRNKLGSIAFGCSVLLSMLFPACVQAFHRTHFRVIGGCTINDVLIETDDGELWFYDNNFKNGTRIICSFDTKGTDSLYDDVLFDLKEISSD